MKNPFEYTFEYIRWSTGIYLVLFWGSTLSLSAQVQNPAMPDTSFGEKVEYLRIGGYMDLYYGSFQPDKKDGSIPYLVSMNQNRQISVNLAYLDLRYAKGRIRSRLIPGFGTYMNANYQGEPGGLAYLVEANAGYCLNPKRQIWLDAGVLSSPYSNESCISKDHLMYSRSLAPEYVPYYLSGIKLSAPLRSNLNLSLYLLNGWQQIRDRNRQPAFGSQLEWRPGKRSLFNWNTYVGNEQTDEAGLKGSLQRMRWFTDVYWIFNPEGRFSLTSCAYAGMQEYASGFLYRRSVWWQANVQLRYRFSKRQSLSARAEYFHDPKQAISFSEDFSNGLRLGSAGLCWNFQLAENAMFRLEGRKFLGKGRIFGLQDQASWVLAGMSLAF